MLVWNAWTSLNMTALSLLGAKLLWAPGCTTRLYYRTIAKSGAGREKIHPCRVVLVILYVGFPCGDLARCEASARIMG